MTLNENHIRQLNEAFLLVSRYDFSDYSEKSLIRRIEKIMSDYKLDFDQLLVKIRNSREFMEQTVKEITVNTTELFRDPKVWQTVKHRILKKLKDKERINIWHAGCSTGQEVYSMKILLHETGLADRTKIYATDINPEVLQKAQKGVYPFRFNIDYLENYKKVVQLNPYNYEEFNNIPFSTYFEVDEIKDTIKVRPFLKKNIIYELQNMVTEENIFNVKYDLIMCRNVLIYFNSRLQNRTFSVFSENLVRKGFLVLGAHETILGPDAFKFIKHGNYYIRK